jgi:hypothetical protein
VENDDTPLTLELTESLLCIKIGVNSLVYAAENYPNEPYSEQQVKVTDTQKYAKEIFEALHREDEMGNTLVTRMFDDAMNLALENGADGVEYFEDEE